MKYVDLIFSGYEPDWGGIPRPENPGYLVDASNVRSTPNGWRGAPSFTAVSGATSIGSYGFGRCFGDGTNNCFFVVTLDGSIYESRAEGTDTWLDVTPAAGGNLTNVYDDFFQFYGDVVVIDPNRTPVKKSLAASHATLFTALGGSPPTAGCGARVCQHVVLGRLSPDQYAIRTSAIGEHEDWPTPGTADARSKEAIQESLNQEYGIVRYIVGGDKFGIVVQEQGLTRMTYVGGSTVYQFDTYERFLGAPIDPLSRPVSDGKLWYWFNRYGVFATDGFRAEKVSKGKIDEAIFTNTISHPYAIANGYSGAYDSRRSLIIWGIAGSPYLVFNTTDGTFSRLSNNSSTAVFNGYSSLGKYQDVYDVNAATNQLQKLSGATGTVALQTAFVEIAPGSRVQIHGAHLLGTGVPGSLALSYKAASDYDSINTLQTGFTAAGTVNSRTLIHPMRADGRFFSFRVTGTGAESQLIRGARVYYTPTSRA